VVSYHGPAGSSSPSRPLHRGASEPATELPPWRSDTTSGDATHPARPASLRRRIRIGSFAVLDQLDRHPLRAPRHGGEGVGRVPAAPPAASRARSTTWRPRRSSPATSSRRRSSTRPRRGQRWPRLWLT